MIMSKLTIVIIVYCFVLVTPTRLLTKSLGCIRNGNVYQNGKTFQPTPCEQCYCESGEATCTKEECFIKLCVDAISDPAKCCPICPNGRNCYAGDTVIPARKKVYLDQHTVCQCPDKVSFGKEALQAQCYITVDSAPFRKIVGK